MSEKNIENPKTLSRRDFLKNAGILAGGTAIGSAVFFSACSGETKEITKTVTTTATGGGSTQTVVKYVCPICSQEFDTVSALGSHIESAHPGQGEIITKYVCPSCSEEFSSLSALQAHMTEAHPSEDTRTGYALHLGNYPYPGGTARIECYEMRCTGCGLCELACSMKHFGVLNKSWARIQVAKFLTPNPKAVQVTCQQCQEEERECEKACPTTPKSIHYDKDTRHMVVNQETCLGAGCLLCQNACDGKAPRFIPEASNKVFICDLCDVDNTGNRDPECIKICPNDALWFKSFNEPDMQRKSLEEKAMLVSSRLYPLTPDTMWKYY